MATDVGDSLFYFFIAPAENVIVPSYHNTGYTIDRNTGEADVLFIIHTRLSI